MSFKAHQEMKKIELWIELVSMLRKRQYSQEPGSSISLTAFFYQLAT
jgi:hypothetical protein